MVDERERVTNAQFYRQCTLMQEDLTKLRAVKEVIHIIDAIKVENQYAKKKLKNNYELHDIEARNTFQKGKVTSAIIKCAHGINLYRLRVEIMNNNTI